MTVLRKQTPLAAFPLCFITLLCAFADVSTGRVNGYFDPMSEYTVEALRL